MYQCVYFVYQCVYFVYQCVYFVYQCVFRVSMYGFRVSMQILRRSFAFFLSFELLFCCPFVLSPLCGYRASYIRKRTGLQSIERKSKRSGAPPLCSSHSSDPGPTHTGKHHSLHRLKGVDQKRNNQKSVKKEQNVHETNSIYSYIQPQTTSSGHQGGRRTRKRRSRIAAPTANQLRRSDTDRNP